MSRRRIVGVLAVSALALTACSSGNGGAPAASPSTAAAPVLDSFEKIGDGIGCLSLGNQEPETTDIANNKYCTLEHPTQEGGGVTVYEYVDAAHRDKSIKAGLVYEQSFLVLNDNWSVSRDVKDLRKIKAVFSTGELRTAEPDGSSTKHGGSGVGPGDSEETFDEAVVVPLGKSVTYQDERVQLGKIFCNSLAGGKNQNEKFDSCRLTTTTDGFGGKARAPKGKEFFMVAFRWKNVGKVPVEPSDFGTLVTDKGLEYAADDDLSSGATNTARGNDDFNTSSDMNPGTEGRILLVYTIPKKTKVKRINWGLDDSSNETPAYALAVK